MIDPAVGERLAAARKRASPTQAQMARALGVSRQVVNDWELGINIPAVRLEQMADYYGVSAHWIRTGEADPAVVGKLSGIVEMLEKSSLDADAKARIMVIAESSAVPE